MMYTDFYSMVSYWNILLGLVQTCLLRAHLGHLLVTVRMIQPTAHLWLDRRLLIHLIPARTRHWFRDYG